VKTAMLGGTFDPIHIGHLLMADEVLTRLRYDRILFVPTRVPPHKRTGPAADAANRLRMLELAVADRPEFVVDPYETERHGVSYTVTTLEHLVARGDVTGRPGLIIGEDLVDGFERWRDVDRVTELADIILVRRPGPTKHALRREHRLIDNLTLEISSTEIRDRVRTGMPYRYLVTPGVYEYIRGRRLYQADSDGT